MRVLAVVAPFDSTAQHRGAAGLDSLHQAMLMQRQRVGLPIGGAVGQATGSGVSVHGCFAHVLSKDIGQLQGWRGQSLAL